MNVTPALLSQRTQPISRVCAIAALMGCAAIASTPAKADVMTPAGLVPGDTFQIVFVTSTTTTATNSDISYYDNFVTNLAGAAGLTTYNGATVAGQRGCHQRG